MTTKKKISICVSVYNEEAVIEKFCDSFESIRGSLKWDYELVFVDDGSLDDSLSILEQKAREREYIKIVSFSRNFGHEAAMIAGIDNCDGDGIICMDSDLQHPLEMINPIIDSLEEGYDVVNMIRLENKSAGIIKNITSKAFYRVINILSDSTCFLENASDFFALSKRSADVLRKYYRDKNRFLRGYIQSIGFKTTTIEYVAPERAGGESHYSIRKLLKFSIDNIICFSDFPLKIGGYAGIVAAFMGLIVLVYTLATYKTAPSGYATIVILICFLFAVLFCVIGVIGKYLAILFSETKDRPIYLIDKKIGFDDKNESN
ncbi:dolichol-phosphate mannosyltransferase [Butyrivibrio sp. ob235]|uniref:glycosyltransferase family 2 protein n=1 Tax=Butyrivibrio sp. ob235 TaxID=1761780 RepID=UPI0008D0E43C|nr:glycosyltransferase family 2 protein [Butyrivibrio sp. ob235]SEM26251.1 dolichol-phosphate mannosyltransferase [Butyrivibrio sp. ob235]